ncbi:MAG: tetratricopeptide repeat protein [Proteobacteria bacterium]|nr:tetratricopeptide repeat protein [Pseudomonadota bacterium]
MNPEVFKAVRRADALNDLGRGAQALAEAKGAIAADPSEPAGYFEACRATLSLGQFEDALAFAEAGLGLDPSKVFGHRLRGACLARLDRWEEARDAVQAALQIWPDQPLAHQQLARIAMELGDHKSAHAHADRATELDPEGPGTWTLRSHVALFNHDAPAALEAARRSVQLGPLDPDALASVAVAELSADNPKLTEAAEAALSALRAAPHRSDLAGLVRAAVRRMVWRAFPFGFLVGLVIGGVLTSPLAGTEQATLGGVLTLVLGGVVGLLPAPVQLLWLERRIPGVVGLWWTAESSRWRR